MRQLSLLEAFAAAEAPKPAPVVAKRASRPMSPREFREQWAVESLYFTGGEIDRRCRALQEMFRREDEAREFLKAFETSRWQLNK